MQKIKKQKASETTTYVTNFKKIKDDLYTITVRYMIKGKRIRTPIFYYRTNNYKMGEEIFVKLIKLIELNLPHLCVNKMKNWLFNTHPIRFLMKSLN